MSLTDLKINESAPEAKSMTTEETPSRFESTDYGELANSTILNLFGDELSYNELKKYSENVDDTSHVKVERTKTKFENKQLITVIIDDKCVLDKSYSLNHSCNMFYYLNEIDECNDNKTTEISIEEAEKAARNICSSIWADEACKFADNMNLNSHHIDDISVEQLKQYDNEKDNSLYRDIRTLIEYFDKQ